MARLDLYNNALTALPRWIGNLSRLEKLNLYGNQLTDVPGEICNVQNLAYLSVSNNPELREFPSKIIELPRNCKITIGKARETEANALRNRVQA